MSFYKAISSFLKPKVASQNDISNSVDLSANEPFDAVTFVNLQSHLWLRKAAKPEGQFVESVITIGAL